MAPRLSCPSLIPRALKIFSSDLIFTYYFSHPPFCGAISLSSFYFFTSWKGSIDLLSSISGSFITSEKCQLIRLHQLANNLSIIRYRHNNTWIQHLLKYVRTVSTAWNCCLSLLGFDREKETENVLLCKSKSIHVATISWNKFCWILKNWEMTHVLFSSLT